MKTCSKCKEEKLFSAFSRNKNRKDGYQSNCKMCVRKQKQANKEKYALQRKKRDTLNKDKIQEYQKEYYLLNKEKIMEYKHSCYEINKEKIIEYKRNYYQINKEKIEKYRSLYYDINKDQISNRMRKYREANKDKVNALTAKRRASRLLATPKWLTVDDFENIAKFYKEAQELKLLTGQEYHVDHIVPLQGENICGLHVPWNLQILTAERNRSKGNKLLED